MLEGVVSGVGVRWLGTSLANIGFRYASTFGLHHGSVSHNNGYQQPVIVVVCNLHVRCKLVRLRRRCSFKSRYVLSQRLGLGRLH